MRNTLHLSTTALLLLALPYYASAGLTKAGPDDIPSENRFNFFDAELIKDIANASPGNVLVSPISVKTMLAMILEGAGGDSAEQIRTALRLPENQEAIRRLFHRFLTKTLEPTSGIKLEMASRVFMAKHLQPSQSYSNSLVRYFSDLVKVDFTAPDITARIINDWVKQFTKGLIPKLIEPGNLQPDSQAVLTNAVYFKGRWKIPFDQQVTSVKCFYTSPGVCHNTNMMETLEFFNFNYIRELDSDAVELPYEGNKFSMLLLAPKEVDGMAQLIRDIGVFPVHSIVSSLEPTEVLVSLPRFQIDFAADIVPALNRLGVREIFGPNSNLTGMFARSEVSAQVSNVFHKAKIIVNEAGSEAAAGTGALVIPLMGSTISKFRADRPFLFFIRDMTTGIVLFAGRVSVPETANYQNQKHTTPSSTNSASENENIQQNLNIFDSMVVPTLRPSQSNSGNSGQGYRPSDTTTRRTNRPGQHHGSQARPTTVTTSSTTEGKTGEYVTNPRESNQASSQRSPPYMVVVRNESPLPAPGAQSTYQQPQSPDIDSINFATQHST